MVTAKAVTGGGSCGGGRGGDGGVVVTAAVVITVEMEVMVIKVTAAVLVIAQSPISYNIIPLPPLSHCSTFLLLTIYLSL